MNINRNNRRSVPTLVISALAVVAAVITWLSFKQVAATAPPIAKPNATVTEEQPGTLGAHVKPAPDTPHAVVGATNLEFNLKVSINRHAD